MNNIATEENIDFNIKNVNALYCKPCSFLQNIADFASNAIVYCISGKLIIKGLFFFVEKTENKMYFIIEL